MRHILALALALAAPLAGAPAAAQVGDPDPSFDGDGIRTEDFQTIDEGNAVALQEDGAILVFGASYETGSGDIVPRLTRYHPDGSLDQSWTYGVGGGSCGTPNLARRFAGGLVDDDGSVLTVGYRQYGCGGLDIEFEVTRIDPTAGGIFDASEQTEFDAGSGWALARQPDGKIVAAGRSSTGVALARYLPDLSLDTTFGGDGQVVVAAGDEFLLTSVAVQADGKIVAVGETADGGDKDFLVVRLEGGGTLDSTFGVGGKVVTDFFGSDDVARGVALQDDGKILVAGIRRDAGGDPGFTVVRYDADGSIDTTFSTDGLVVVDFAGLPAAARTLTLQGDDKIVVAGSSETGAGGGESRDFAVARLHPSGALDPSFAGDGRQTVEVGFGQTDFILGMTLQPFDGHVLVVGGTRELIDEERHDDIALVRLLGDSCSLESVVSLAAQDVATERRFQACDEVQAGTGGFRVMDGGDVTFRAGSLIVLEDGFEIQSGGSFRVVIE